MTVNFAQFSGHLCDFQAAKGMCKLACSAIIHPLDQERNHIFFFITLYTDSFFNRLALECSQMTIPACPPKQL